MLSVFFESSHCAASRTILMSHVSTETHNYPTIYCAKYEDSPSNASTDAIAPYLNWSVCEAALIIMTGCVPSLRPLLATVLPRFFRLPYYSRFSTLFSGKRGTMMAPVSSPRPHHMQSADSWRPESSSAESTKGLGVGTITITKEYHIEASHRQQRPGSIWPGTRPMTPSARFAPRAIVTCEKSRSP